MVRIKGGVNHIAQIRLLSHYFIKRPGNHFGAAIIGDYIFTTVNDHFTLRTILSNYLIISSHTP